ncbi:hypothetical protein DFH06DRAFT_1336887 [Mycena polygramma]|nr:hypothetical protein DFH06DRAFT_1336887 [Mycena polygramma]
MSPPVWVEDLTLPELSQTLGPDNLIKETQVRITNKTMVKDLQGHLASYGLAISGKNKAVLVTRLREYANDRERWMGIFQARTKRSRGDITGSRVNTHSGKRIVSQFGQAEIQSEYPSKRVAVRGQREINEAEIAASDSWAAAALSSLPSSSSRRPAIAAEEDSEEADERHNEPLTVLIQPSTERTNVPQQEQVITQEDGTLIGDQQIPTMITALSAQVNALSQQIQMPRREEHRRTDLRLRKVERELKSVKSNISDIHWGVSRLVAANDAPAGAPPLLASSSHPPNALGLTEPSSTARNENVPSSTFVPAEAIDPEKLMVVVLENDEEFSFDVTRVPNPPNIHFSGDIPRLFREWEDSKLLMVNGRGIAIKYWPLFYKRRKQAASQKNGAWDKIRTEWGNWKFLVEERQQFTSEDDFWRSHSTANGTHLRFQQILDALKESRERRDKVDAAAARRFFHADLDHSDADGAFAYVKSGKRRIKDQDSSVAEIWRELLVNNLDIARRWAEIQVEREFF